MRLQRIFLATATPLPAEHVDAEVDFIGRKTLDIIVPVYKSVELTARCLKSLAEHLHEIENRDPRLIIINDSPNDGDVDEMLKVFAARNPRVTLLKNERNLGFVGAVNRGLSIACKAGRDVILVNADTETFPGTLRNLLLTADADPQIAFVSPRSNNASFCSLPHFYGGTVADQAESQRRWRVLSRTLPPFHFTPTAVGFYLFIRHAVIANFGFLDPEFGLGYEEENDLILRAGKVGYRAALANHAFAYHAGSASFTLVDMNLRGHQEANLRKMAERHAEYLPLVRRYEGSAHFRAERLLSHLLPTSAGRLKVVFDLSSVGPHHNGTNEMGMAILNGLYERHSDKFEIHAICSEKAFTFHELNRHPELRRHEVDLQTRERFAIGIQIGQPFDVHAITVLEDLAVINVFGMLDTIAEDCGQLSITHQLDVIWGHVARHANGLFFNSRYSECVFLARYSDANRLTRYPRLLPTKLSAHKKPNANSSADHVLIMGNHFAHQASDATAAMLKAAFPNVPFVVLGAHNGVTGKLKSYRSGSLTEAQMDSLYSRASVVVLPSHVEGFGSGLVHAISAGKVVVARDIPVTREILSTYGRLEGVLLYPDDGELVKTMLLAMDLKGSSADDAAAHGWEDWVDGFAEFCSKLAGEEDLFPRLVNRIQAGDLIRRSELLERLQRAAPSAPHPPPPPEALNEKYDGPGLKDGQGRLWLPVNHVEELLALDGEEFVHRAYVTLLNRIPDGAGLVNYLKELQAGVDKFVIVERLRYSTEGKEHDRSLSGYRTRSMKRRLRNLLR